MIPAEDPDSEALGPAFPAWAPPGQDAILQPPKPQIHPSARILERVPPTATSTRKPPTDHSRCPG